MPFRSFVSRRYLMSDGHKHPSVLRSSPDSSRSILPMQFAPAATAVINEIIKDAADADIKALADWVGA